MSNTHNKLSHVYRELFFINKMVPKKDKIIKYLSVNLMYTYKLKIKKVQGSLNESVRRNGITLRIKSPKRLSKNALFEKADSYLNKNYGVRLVEARTHTGARVSGNTRLDDKLKDYGVNTVRDIQREFDSDVPYQGMGRRLRPRIANSDIHPDEYRGENKKIRGNRAPYFLSNRYSERYYFKYAIYKSKKGDRPVCVAWGDSDDLIKKNPDIVSNVLKKYGLDRITDERSVLTARSKGKVVKYFEGVYKCEDIKNVKAFDQKNSLKGIITKKEKEYDKYDNANYYIAYRAMPYEYYMDNYYDEEPLFEPDYYVDVDDTDTDWNESGTVGVRRDRDVYDDDRYVSSDYRYNADSDTWVGDDYPDY